MGGDTSAMVIPSFYTCDHKASPFCVQPKLERPGEGGRESEIITNLFLGDLQDARRFEGMIISVLPDTMVAEPKRTIHLPFLLNGRATLDTTAALIDSGLRLRPAGRLRRSVSLRSAADCGLRIA